MDAMSFVDVIRRHAAMHPTRRAFTFLENGETESDTLTYGELDRDARAIAVSLQARTQVGPGAAHRQYKGVRDAAMSRAPGVRMYCSSSRRISIRF